MMFGLMHTCWWLVGVHGRESMGTVSTIVNVNEQNTECEVLLLSNVGLWSLLSVRCWLVVLWGQRDGEEPKLTTWSQIVAMSAARCKFLSFVSYRHWRPH
ncbi:unnamed protein product [Ostreobium quekettii]|uniref:Secreted protein n=1 Tax=Ostreobium quekettii TaxID=121088 RepID=A0A8S1IYI1_9CHLO|nr:unnamed protein product [Ostreobium quekettii]